jgi:hypothetical protein
MFSAVFQPFFILLPSSQVGGTDSCSIKPLDVRCAPDIEHSAKGPFS